MHKTVEPRYLEFTIIISKAKDGLKWYTTRCKSYSDLNRLKNECKSLVTIAHIVTSFGITKN